MIYKIVPDNIRNKIKYTKKLQGIEINNKKDIDNILMPKLYNKNICSVIKGCLNEEWIIIKENYNLSMNKKEYKEYLLSSLYTFY